MSCYHETLLGNPIRLALKMCFLLAVCVNFLDMEGSQFRPTVFSSSFDEGRKLPPWVLCAFPQSLHTMGSRN